MLSRKPTFVDWDEKRFVRLGEEEGAEAGTRARA
ncbi:hypothetical protein E2C01_067091 [Portunus trituberculatus]|uniref:Uncharacterized protein n=1 Tax=Portunus trituberculatus TaxID=210409 RepID=A0A5B7HVM8_PORTR|nr:hypothetical protein [Portunus trituberculatus]